MNQKLNLYRMFLLLFLGFATASVIYLVGNFSTFVDDGYPDIKLNESAEIIITETTDLYFMHNFNCADCVYEYATWGTKTKIEYRFFESQSLNDYGIRLNFK